MFPNFIKGKIVNVAEVNQRHCLEESEQWLENVDRTNQALVALEKKLFPLEADSNRADF